MLLKRLKPYNDESIGGFSYRVARENGYQTPRWLFGLEKGELYCDKDIEKDKYLSQLASCLNCQVAELKELTYSSIGNSLLLECNDRQIGRMLNKHNQKFCPLCLKDEYYHRYYWDINLISVCTKHKVALIKRCPECNRALTFNKIFNGKCSCGLSISDMESYIISDEFTIKVHQFIQSMLLNDNCKTEILEKNNPILRLSKKSFFWLITVISEILRYYPTASYSIKTNERLVSAENNKLIRSLSIETCLDMCTTSFKLLINWPYNFYKFLAEYREVYAEENKPRLTRDYGKLLRLFRKELNYPEYKFVWDAFKNFLLLEPGKYEVYSVTHLSDISFEDELYLSQKRVIEKLGVTRDYFNKLMDTENVNRRTISIKKGVRHIFSIDDYFRLKDTYDRNVLNLTIAEASRKLGVSRPTIEQFIKEGLLDLVQGINNAEKMNMLISYESFEKFRSVFLVKTDECITGNGTLINFKDAVNMLKRHGITCSDFLLYIKQEEIKFSINQPNDGLLGIQFLEKDIIKLLENMRSKIINNEGYSLPEAQDYLNADVVTIKKWIELGLLEATNVRHNGVNSYRVTNDDIEKFKKTYTFLTQAAKEFNVPRNTIHNWLKIGLIKPLFGPCADGNFRYIFRKKDLIKVLKIKERI
ncbi:MAG: hypothetical protein FH758_08135 [Firmicutes bacterium]|nr:hypothetical protein [Bacillota bacterium]